MSEAGVRRKLGRGGEALRRGGQGGVLGLGPGRRPACGPRRRWD